ncbi:MAG: transporter substrate-binding domain-containing protein [Acidimicrobiia bacterium]|nr:transporter substrate-binding domain-containing protein [Acidimicrobiia bacterium]
MLIGFGVALLPFSLPAQPAPSAPIQPPKKIIYGGDAVLPPYEYLDESGQPKGFNIELIRAISRPPLRPI